MSILQRLRLEVGDDCVRLQKSSKNILNVFECRVLPHAGRHILGRRQEPVNLLPQLPRLYGRPRHLSQLSNLAPNARKCCPDGLEVLEFLKHGFKAGMTRQLEVESFFGPAHEVVFFLDTIKFSFENVDGIHSSIGTHASLHGTCLFPFR